MIDLDRLALLLLGTALGLNLAVGLGDSWVEARVADGVLIAAAIVLWLIGRRDEDDDADDPR